MMDFSKTNQTNNYAYIGFCSSFESTDAGLTYRDYKWSRYKGNDGLNGSNAVQFKLVDFGSYAQVKCQYDSDGHIMFDLDGTLSRYIEVYFNVKVYAINGMDSIAPLSQSEINTIFEVIYRDSNTSWYDAYAHNYIQPDSSGVVTRTLNNETYSQRIKFYELGLYNTHDNIYIDTMKIPVVTDSQATLDVINDVESRITATVQDVSDNLATLNMTATDISTRVSNNTNSISSISQKADNI